MQEQNPKKQIFSPVVIGGMQRCPVSGAFIAIQQPRTNELEAKIAELDEKLALLNDLPVEELKALVKKSKK